MPVEKHSGKSMRAVNEKILDKGIISPGESPKKERRVLIPMIVGNEIMPITMKEMAKAFLIFIYFPAMLPSPT